MTQWHFVTSFRISRLFTACALSGEEPTEFHYAKDATLYPLILDGFQTPYEDEYQVRQVSGMHRDWLIGLPLLADVSGIGWVGVTEADIDKYAGMYLRKDHTSATPSGASSGRMGAVRSTPGCDSHDFAEETKRLATSAPRV